MSIHLEVMDLIQQELVAALITALEEDDDTKAGTIIQGHLQDDPSASRITLEIFENDPDAFLSGQPTGLSGTWDDEVVETECGGGVTWNRRFTVKMRCLLTDTQEDIANARRVAQTVRARAERTLMNISFAGVDDGTEKVVRGIFAETMKSEALQAGGPPDSYDFIIKIRFDVQTEQTVTVSV